MVINTRHKLAVYIIVCCTLYCSLLAIGGCAQSGEPQVGGQSSAQQVNDAIATVTAGKTDPYHLEVIAEARAFVAIPAMEKQFTLETDPLVKAKIAQVLLLFGDKKDAYWNFLEDFVKPGLENDLPEPNQYDSQRTQIPGLSPEFVA
jgi:hypothetical protein